MNRPDKTPRTPADCVATVTPLLQVFDMPRSLAFYRDALGFRVLGTSQAGGTTSSPVDECDWAMLFGGGVESGSGIWLMLNTAYERDERPPSPDAARVAAHADSTLYFICANADTAYRLLREAGLEPSEPATAHYGMRQTYLKDPDGYELCFQSLPDELEDSRSAL